MGRKHCGKRKNCSLRAIAPFPTVFSKDMYCRHVKPGLVWERFNLNFPPIQKKQNFKQAQIEEFVDNEVNVKVKMKFVSRRVENKEGKRRKCWLPAFSLLSLFFSKGL